MSSHSSFPLVWGETDIMLAPSEACGAEPVADATYLAYGNYMSYDNYMPYTNYQPYTNMRVTICGSAAAEASAPAA